MDKAIDQSFYVPLDVEEAVNNHGELVQNGVPCRVSDLKGILAWMRGHVNGWYGWSNDGKGTMLDFLSVLMAKYDSWKICMLKPEDMDTVLTNGKAEIKANRMYKNLAWTLTGKTWNKGFADRNKCSIMSLSEQQEALSFITDHIYIVNAKDRNLASILQNFMFMYEMYGIDMFIIDPWNIVKLLDNSRGDERLIDAFIEIKDFAMRTNSVVNIVNHAKSMIEVKDKNGRYKVVNQFMQLGGSAWDIKMDGQFSVYRPERHINPDDPKVELFNLKQRAAEIVGVNRGSYDKIIFDKVKRQYYFDGVNPITGDIHADYILKKTKQANIDFKNIPPNDDVPF